MDGYKQEENIGGKNMNKMFKAMAMLLVITAVVFAAGCSSPQAPAENKTTPAPTENKTTPAETTNVTPATTAETTGPVVIPAATNETANVTENVSENVTENATASAAKNLGKAARNKALIASHQVSSTNNTTTTP